MSDPTINSYFPSKRVVVTGVGVVSPLGNTLEEFTEKLLAGTSAAQCIDIFDPAQLPTRIAAQSKVDIEEGRYINDRKVLFALAASQAAIQDAGIRESLPAQDYRLGLLSIGLGLELFSMPDMVSYIYEDGASIDVAASRSLFHLQTPSDICVHMINERHELQLAPQIHVSACSASSDAIGSAFRSIKQGQCRWALAGGTDSMINPLGVAGFCKLNALTTRNENPTQASRPFDSKRDGFLLGEGAAFLVLESLASAQARSAHIYAEICGYGNSFDAHGISEPHPSGAGAVLAMQAALREAEIAPSSISYINAHGTSTPKNDVVETLAIKRVFGDHAYRLKISSTKSMIGHLISAAGAVESAAMLACAQRRRIHPTINLNQTAPECDLDYVGQGSESLPDGYWMKNSFGFGGQNASLVFAPASGFSYENAK